MIESVNAMNAAHLHLILKHLPGLGTVFGLGWTANLSGEILYTEIRAHTIAPTSPPISHTAL